MKKNSFFFLITLILLVGCDNRKPTETTTNEAAIYCDSDFKYIMELQREVYLSDVKDEHITIQYMSGEEVLQNLLNGNVQVAIIGRKLTDEELAQIRKVNTSSVREHLMAKDAVAMIIGKNNPLKALNWKTFLSELQTGNLPYNLVFDSKQSGVVRSFDFLSNTNTAKTGIVISVELAKNAGSKNLFALDSVAAVLDYINADDNAIGFLPYAKFSDEFNVEMQELLTKIKLLPIEITDSTGQKLTLTASQSEIALNDYPLIRPLNFIIAKPREDVSRNFVNYLYKNRGAKVFLKAGLIPAIMPERDFIVNTTDIDVKKE